LWNNKITILRGGGAKVLACLEFTSTHKKRQGDARRFLCVENEKAAWDSTPPDLKLLGTDQPMAGLGDLAGLRTGFGDGISTPGREPG
jgi:hypothetical protein